MNEDKQEKETIEHSSLAVIEDREKSTLGVHHEIGDRHFSGCEQRADAGQKPERDEKSADEFDPGSSDHQSFVRGTMSARWEAEKFLSTVTGEQQANDQPRNAKNRIRKSVQRVHG